MDVLDRARPTTQARWMSVSPPLHITRTVYFSKSSVAVLPRLLDPSELNRRVSFDRNTERETNDQSREQRSLRHVIRPLPSVVPGAALDRTRHRAICNLLAEVSQIRSDLRTDRQNQAIPPRLCVFFQHQPAFHCQACLRRPRSRRLLWRSRKCFEAHHRAASL